MVNDINRFIGTKLEGKYEIKQLLGKGGSGNVFKGWHIIMGVPVAIKILHPHLVSDETAVKRFQQEAKLAFSIRHDNAVSMLDIGIIENELLYLVMELINGVSLSYLLHQEPQLNIPRAVRLIKQVCSAVEAAHKKDIIHRDLKPGNIMIVDHGQPRETAKVIDFSISKLVGGKGKDLTSQGFIIGTPEYISPEQIEGIQSLDTRADIYSLGVVFYQMLTGELPFSARSVATLFLNHVHVQPPLPSSIRPDISAKLDAVILKALAKKPSDRYQNINEFVDDLDLAMEDFMSSSSDMVKSNASVNIILEKDTPTMSVSRDNDAHKQNYQHHSVPRFPTISVPDDYTDRPTSSNASNVLNIPNTPAPNAPNTPHTPSTPAPNAPNTPHTHHTPHTSHMPTIPYTTQIQNKETAGLMPPPPSPIEIDKRITLLLGSEPKVASYNSPATIESFYTSVSDGVVTTKEELEKNKPKETAKKPETPKSFWQNILNTYISQGLTRIWEFRKRQKVRIAK